MQLEELAQALLEGVLGRPGEVVPDARGVGSGRAQVPRAARLEADLYAEVEADKTATQQAAAVVFLASVAGGISTGAQPFEVILGALLGLGGWYLFSYVVFWVGARLLNSLGLPVVRNPKQS